MSYVQYLHTFFTEIPLPSEGGRRTDELVLTVAELGKAESKMASKGKSFCIAEKAVASPSIRQTRQLILYYDLSAARRRSHSAGILSYRGASCVVGGR